MGIQETVISKQTMKKQAFNPYLPSYEYIPDGEPYVFNKRVYVYGSHDRFNGTQYCMNNYVCWSAPEDDLSDWRYEGVIYDKMQDPICESEDRLLFAPDVTVGPDGRYYLYYAFDFCGIMSVAVCDTPAGKYEFYGHVHYADGTLLGKRDGDGFQFDPGVLTDDNGKVYLYSGFCPLYMPWEHIGIEQPIIKGGMVTELENDMVTVKKDPQYIFPWKQNSAGTGFEGHEFFEAASIRKIDGKYYFIYSSFNGHELCYATSDYPDREFKYGGTIISNGDIYLDGRMDKDMVNYTGNNHGSIVKINGEWYVFYHRQTNKHQFSRQGCAEKICILPDGSIPQTEMTSCGLNGKPLEGKGEYDASIVCNLMSREGALRYEFGVEITDIHPFLTQDGEDREDIPAQYIANMTDGSIAGFKYFDMENPVTFAIQTRGNGNGTIVVSTKMHGDALAEIQVKPAGEWTWFSCDITEKIKGKNPVYFEYKGEGHVDVMKFRMI